MFSFLLFFVFIADGTWMEVSEFAFKMMGFALTMMDFVFKMMEFEFENE